MRVYRPRLGGNIYLANLQSGSIDSNVAAFVLAQNNAGQTLTSTEIGALNTFVLAAKLHGYWSSFLAFYPVVGGTATSHSFNLVDPTTFQIIWGGTIIHDVNGITGDGITSLGNTGIIPGTIPSFVNSLAFGVYNRSSFATGVAIYAFTGTGVGIIPHFSDGNAYFDNGTSARMAIAAGSSPGPLGLQTSSRISAAVNAGFQRATKITSNTNAQGTLDANFFFIFSQNGGNVSAANLTTVFVGNGITDAQIVDFNTDIQIMQTTLSRQV